MQGLQKNQYGISATLICLVVPSAAHGLNFKAGPSPHSKLSVDPSCLTRSIENRSQQPAVERLL